MTLGILILAAAGMLAGIEVGLIQGPIASLVLAAGAVTALMFSLMKGKVGAMAGNRGVMNHDDELPQKFLRMSDADKDEIAQMVFDRLILWASRSIIKKLWLIFLAIAFAIAGWIVKDHINIK